METLNEQDSKTYTMIVTKGNMDDMFDFAYQCGRVDMAKEIIEMQQVNLKD